MLNISIIFMLNILTLSICSLF